MTASAKPTYDDLLALVGAQAQEIGAQAEQIGALVRELAEARARVEELERRLGGGGRKPPHFVKEPRPPKPEGEPRERKKRVENHARPHEEATEEVVHRVERCSGCGQALGGGWVHRVRQVIDLPPPTYIVRAHVMMRYRCGVCGRVQEARPDLSGEVVGRHRVSVRVMALVSHLKTVCRLPLRAVQRTLGGVYGLHLSEGELTGILHETARLGRARVEALWEEYRASRVGHADETGHRENGVNCYLWAFVAPGIRLHLHDRSRGAAVALRALGADFPGVLVSDFYAGYSPLTCRKQRCWVHLLRALKELEEAHPGNRVVVRWRQRVRDLFERATAYRARALARSGPVTPKLAEARRRSRLRCEEALLKLARPHLGRKDDPCRILAKRMERFASELFVFVEDPEVPPDNNLAERAMREVVTVRKISGGTRSPRGSETLAILHSLFGTWAARGEDPLLACTQLLAAPSP